MPRIVVSSADHELAGHLCRLVADVTDGDTDVVRTPVEETAAAIAHRGVECAVVVLTTERDASDQLEVLRRANPSVPIIAVAPDVATEAASLGAGVAEVILRAEVDATTLARAIRRAPGRRAGQVEAYRREVQLNRALSVGRVGSWTWRPSTGEVTWTDQLLALFGLEPATVPSYELYESLLHPDDRAMVREALAGALREHTPLDYTSRFIARDGRLLWIHSVAEATRGDDGELVLAGAARDITEDRLLVAQHTIAAAIGQRALGGAPLDDILADATDQVAWALDSDVVEVLGLAPDGDTLRLRAGVGWPPELIGVATVGADNRSPAGYTIKAGEPVVVASLQNERRFRAGLVAERGVRSGVLVPIAAGARRFGVLGAFFKRARTVGGPEIGFLSTVAQALALAFADEEREQLRRRAEKDQRLAAVGRVAAGAAHDFNNVITVINLAAHALAEPAAGTEWEPHVEVIRRQADRAVGMVWQILDFASAHPPVMADVDLSGVLDQAVQDLERTLPGDVTVLNEHPPRPITVRGDATKLHQVVGNLLTNARDAVSSDGGMVRVSASTVRRPPGAAGSPPDGASRRVAQVQITDDGPGIPDDLRHRVFEPFFTTKANDAGTGLGLAQVERLVAQHGGHLELTSAVGAGTTVTVWLPLATAPIVAPVTTAAHASSRAGGAVVVVDDDRDLRDLLGRIVATLGYDPIPAADGEEALAVLDARGGEAAAVFTDLLMPGMGGLGLAREIERRWSDLPVIVTSGLVVSVDDDDEHRFYVPKPFTIELVAGVLEAAIGH